MRLSGGVVPGPERRIWAPGPRGRAVEPGAELVPGSPVVLGPRPASPEAAEQAIAELARLVASGGPLAAGAGVDLGYGFRSARVEGAAGDRRDAVLAALMVPGLAGRLGDRRAVLVALFGPDATKPLGAAAQAVLDDGRWPVLRFAVAASDVLGPEQLVRVLELRAPDGIDPFPGRLPSVVGGQLTRVLREVPRPRRLALLTDLWQQVCADGATRLRRERLRASQGRQDRTADLTARYRRYEEDELTLRLRRELGPEPTVLQAALWRPSAGYWLTRADRVLRDALAATVLARLAATAVDRGLDAALAKHRHEIEAAVDGWPRPEASLSARRTAGLTGLPARPGSYLRDILARSRPGEPLDSRAASYLRQRLARARDYGRMVLDAAEKLVDSFFPEDSLSLREQLAGWAGRPLSDWRDRVGYLSPDRTERWDHQPILSTEPPLPPLAERLRAAPQRPVAEVETIGDLLWYAELADALAQLNGHPQAVLSPHLEGPTADTDPAPPDEPLVPRSQSIPLAVAGAAQLVNLGATVPPRCWSWPELVAGLVDNAAIASALTGAFAVPTPVEHFDGTVLPGTDARIELARTARQLADWSHYMGNCIASPHYVEDATPGRSALIALRAPDGRILVNAELRPSARGWRLEEIRARFNEDPDPTLLRQTGRWLRALALPEPAIPEPRRAAPYDETGPGQPARATRPRPAVRVLRDLGHRLDELAAATVAEPEAVRAAELLAVLATRLAGAPATPASDPHDALTALRRATPAAVARACRLTLADPAGPGLVALWQASGYRPLARAVGTLPPSRPGTPAPPTVDRLAPLLVDAPLPGSLRPLARVGQVAVARTADLVALRLRAALGTLLRQDAAELAEAVRARPHPGLLRSAALAVTSWGGLPTGRPDARPSTADVTAVAPRRRVRVPGFPQSSLRDENWQSGWPDAIELGAVPDGFWDRVATHGLVLPSSWLADGGWVPLWSRANGPDR
ncbi:hypothetical protein GCM10022225_05010 [Plantactinospora mayteni]|uniref:Uncharacterized protein n=1 Tax=Plantactinospora mayteni TaxID=566021 RepID=A0ABQ4EQU0_9ACTN|nr:hypothetical protein Pma05_35630 [Plantactinospora mayteni]